MGRLTEQDGERLIEVLNELTEVARDRFVPDLHLQYRFDVGWRSRLAGTETGWSKDPGGAVRAVLVLLRKQLDQNAEDTRKRRRRRRRA